MSAPRPFGDGTLPEDSGVTGPRADTDVSPLRRLVHKCHRRFGIAPLIITDMGSGLNMSHPLRLSTSVSTDSIGEEWDAILPEKLLQALEDRSE